MQTILGTIYGGLVAAIFAFVLDLLLVNPDPDPEKPESSFPIRLGVFVGIILLGAAIGGRKGHRLDKAKGSGRSEDDDL